MNRILLTCASFVVVFLATCIELRESGAQEYTDIETQQTEQGLSNIGYAPFNLTAPGFNCTGFVRSLRPLKEIHISFLYNTFGNDFSCLNLLLADPRVKTLEVGLINEPGHRNNRLGGYEFLRGIGTVKEYNVKMQKRSRTLKNKFTRYVVPLQENLLDNLQDHTALLVNPGLESNLNAKAGKVLVSWTRALFPSARIVWNPLRVSSSSRKYVRADLFEGHGLYPVLHAPCIYNMDGMDVKYKNRPALGESSGDKNYLHSGTPLFQHLEKYGNKCEVAFIWTQESSGISYKDTGFKDPRKRNHFISTDRYKQIMADVVSLHRRGKISPITDTYTNLDDDIVKTCSSVSSRFEDGLKSGRLLKQSEFPDRGGVLILPTEFTKVRRAFLVKGKTIIDRYESVGIFHDGRLLFRSDKSPTKYPFNTYLYFDTGDQRRCYKISNPRIRND